MRLPDNSAPAAPLPRARVVRMLARGILAAGIVAGVCGAAEAWRFGRDDEAARRRVEREVRDAFDTMARSLRDAAATMAVHRAAFRDTGADDVIRARLLFDAAQHVVGTDRSNDIAITAYAVDGRPLAWAGRASELPPNRLQGPGAWFFAQGPLGLRLVYVQPVVDGEARVGTIAAERALDTGTRVREPDPGDARFPTSIAPVSIELESGTPRTNPGPTFDVASPDGERLLTASVSDESLSAARARFRRLTISLVLASLAVTLLLLMGPVLDWRNGARTVRPYVAAAGAAVVLIVLARLLLRIASPADWSDAPLFSASAYASPLLRGFLTSPFDFVLTALAAGGLTALALFGVEAWRIESWRSRRPVQTPAIYLAVQLAGGVTLAGLLMAHLGLVRDTIANTTLDLLHLSLHPLDSARLALQLGLVAWNAVVLGAGVLILRAAQVPWCVPRRNWQLRGLTVAAWILPAVGWQLALRTPATRQLPLLVAAGVVCLVALAATRLKARYRHGSQAFRLTMLVAGLVLPALALYPTAFQLAWRAKSQFVETRNAPQALNQRETIKSLLQQSLQQIDALPGLADLASAGEVTESEAATDRAFGVWRATGLAAYPMTSSVEIHGPDGTLVSRFAFNLPEDLTASQQWLEPGCAWELYEEVSPFFAEERRVLHAGRGLCDGSGRPAGSVVVHAMLDYANLPFISSQNPYVELLRPADPLRGEGVSGGDVEFAVYGWSRQPLYASGATAWPLDDATFARVLQSRRGFWTELQRSGERYDVYLLNDRGAIYALGFPVVSPLGHLVNLAELTVLAGLLYVLLLAANAITGPFSRRGTSAPALLREVRASFYRKLFLAFVAAAVLPVVALALVTSNYVARQMRATIEEEALRTASAARRVVEDLAAPRAAQQGVSVDDNLMVWVSRLIDQDANIFVGPTLLATSERNLFASGLLPTRTPADVYRALELRHEAAAASTERIGSFEYMVAATHMSSRPFDAILTVPLTSRQQEIESEIDTLNRRVLLAVLIFVMAGAGLGYYMAERIADPVNRLTRATRRIARGDLDARIAATSSDELRRLVEDFNRMAADLQRQRKELERTNRLEAWAEMARQVAHDIKNPLTPIQLNAEHLRRVHADRGEPLSPVLQECVATILTQVKLLRQIASEFSSFASSPIARPAPVDVSELLREIVDPYRAGLSERVRFDVDLPRLRPAFVDRTLLGRALTNIVENALAAMPTAGTLTVRAREDADTIVVRVSDTGVGMDAQALARAFEPYFSTKASGTGLGLPIAKRNVELNGGTVAIDSVRNGGTTVEVRVPAA